MRKYILLGVTALLALNTFTVNAQRTPQFIEKGRKNSPEQEKKPYVIMISADGFRYDYAEKYHADNLLRLSAGGVRAVSMLPSFPSLTFPNHYTLATGLYPSHHGLVGNSFYDPAKNAKYSMGDNAKVTDGSWYGGTPIWVLAEQQKMLSASLFWVGSEADVKGIRPTYYYTFDDKLPLPDRIEIVKDWLKLPEEKRPHIIMFYLSEADHAGHSFGPDAPETEHAARLVDQVVKLLTDAVKTIGLPVNYVFVSDHGMTNIDQEHPLSLPQIDPSKFVVTVGGTIADIHAKDKADIQPLYEQLKKDETNYKVYLKTNTPAYWHYGAIDDTMNRIGDILLVPTWPKMFSRDTPLHGNHGYDPRQVKDMQATFMAWGPAFKSGVTVSTFENVNVYPLVAKILGLNITDKIDGSIEVLGGVLK